MPPLDSPSVPERVAEEKEKEAWARQDRLAAHRLPLEGQVSVG